MYFFTPACHLKILLAKTFFGHIIKMPLIKKNLNNCNSVNRSVKVENGDYLKKNSQEFENYFCYVSYEFLVGVEGKIRKCIFS